MKKTGNRYFRFTYTGVLTVLICLQVACNPAVQKEQGPTETPVNVKDTIIAKTPELELFPADNKRSIRENIEKEDSLTDFYAALKLSALTEMLSRNDSFTIFVPNNAAVRKMPAGGFGNLLNPQLKSSLQNVLRFHIVNGVYPISVLAKTASLKTIEGKELQIAAGDKITLNGAAIVQADGRASNGIIHVIDAVLLPRKPGKLPREE